MKRAVIRLVIAALSMPLAAPAVKAQDKPLPSSNQSAPSPDQSELSRLVKTLMTSGLEGKYDNGYAQAGGLNGPMPLKAAVAPIGDEVRRCHIVYEADKTAGNRPVCIKLVRTKKTKSDLEERHYRVNLDGKLEAAITLRNKRDGKGKGMKEGRSRVVEDIDSPELQKAFKTEMAFWLKDWLRKQPKPAAKKPSASPAAK